METFSSKLIDDLLDSIDPVEQAKTDAKMLIAAKIADAMKAKGWRNNDLLKAVNKENPSIITKWLSGTHNFTVDTLVELGNALDINLLNLSEPRPKVVLYYKSVSQKASTTCLDDNQNHELIKMKKLLKRFRVGSSQTSLISQQNFSMA